MEGSGCEQDVEEAECLHRLDEAGSVVEPSAVCTFSPYGIIASLFRRSGCASRVLADALQYAHLHMNLLKKSQSTNHALVSSPDGESVTIGGDIKTALRSVARNESNSP